MLDWVLEFVVGLFPRKVRWTFFGICLVVIAIAAVVAATR